MPSRRATAATTLQRQAQQTFAVGKGIQTISFTSTAPAAAVVGGATYSVTATGGASGNPVTFTIDATAASVCSISGSTVSFIGTGSCVIDANQAGNGSYNAAPQAQQTFAVGKGDQTISFTSTAPAAAVVGGATYSVTATGGASGSPVTFTIDASATSVCSISWHDRVVHRRWFLRDRLPIRRATVATMRHRRHNKRLLWAKATQKISFTSTAPAAAVVGGATYNVTATGGASGSPVTFTIDASATSVCSISGTTVSFIGAGSCVIDAKQAGNGSYNAAGQAQQTFAVGKGIQATLTANATPAAIAYNGTSTLGSTGGSGSGALSYVVMTGENICAVTGTTLTGTGIGTCVVTATKASDANYSSATATVSVTVNPVLSVSGANPVGNGTITLGVNTVPGGCGITQSQFLALPPAGAPILPGVTILYGMVGMTISGSCGNGATATITLQYPNALPANAQVWKYGKTAGDSSSHWYSLSSANNVNIAGHTVSYTVTDGGLGDDDLTANGSITDPVAVVVPSVTTPIPTLSVRHLGLLAVLIALLAMCQLAMIRRGHIER